MKENKSSSPHSISPSLRAKMLHFLKQSNTRMNQSILYTDSYTSIA